MIKMTPSFYLKKEKNSKHLKDSVFIETSGLGHSMHSDELYKNLSSFIWVIIEMTVLQFQYSAFDIEHIKLKKVQ
jgi:hypothetical protein